MKGAIAFQYNWKDKLSIFAGPFIIFRIEKFPLGVWILLGVDYVILRFIIIKLFVGILWIFGRSKWIEIYSSTKVPYVRYEWFGTELESCVFVEHHNYWTLHSLNRPSMDQIVAPRWERDVSGFRHHITTWIDQCWVLKNQRFEVSAHAAWQDQKQNNINKMRRGIYQ